MSAEPKPLGRRWRKGGKAASRARGVWESHRHPGPPGLSHPSTRPPRCMARSPPSPGVGKRRGSKPGCQMDGTLAPAEPLKGPPCCTAGYSLMSGAGNMSSFFIRYSPASPPDLLGLLCLPPGVLQQACGQRCRNCPTAAVDQDGHVSQSTRSNYSHARDVTCDYVVRNNRRVRHFPARFPPF